MRLYYNVNKLVICLIFTSLAACSKDTSSTSYDPYEDLNAQHTKEIMDIITSLNIEHSDLIESLRAQETNDLFLPYIASYEAHKSSPIHPDIKIFFFDRSKLPENHVVNFFIGMCFLREFIFIDRDFWFTLNPSEDLILRYSILKGFSEDGTYQQSSKNIDGSISREVERYEELSEEERQERIEIIQRLEEKLSEDEKIAARQLRRELILFHELGHCDLGRDHEIISHSIMSYETVSLIGNNQAIKKEECPEDLSFEKAMEECRMFDIEVSYYNLIQKLFSTQPQKGMSPLKLNPEAARLLYQETFQYMQMYTNAIDHEVQNNLD